ncbi:hypothetical protein A3K87_21055 [Variovorax paradoxus]|uniref:Uncharacterized protein n=1 Tax=Variovorax paradoxus TaxID=34073 RepID=A0AA91DLV3_VARPD|nr:hypothetical protein A3K87_21055 [Variovorax paradoxus]
MADEALEDALYDSQTLRDFVFRHKKVRYRGLAKNTAQLFSLFGLANMVIAKKPLLALHVRGAS